MKKLKYNKKQLRVANAKLETKGLQLVVRGESLKCVIIYSIDNMRLLEDQDTLNLINQVNKDIMDLGFIGSHSINLF